MRASIVLLGLTMLCLPLPAAAQTAPTILVGERIRVTTRGDSVSRFAGKVVRALPDTLVVLREPKRYEVPVDVASIVQLDRSVRHHSRVLQGALLGLVIGGTIGTVSGQLSGDDPPGWWGYTRKEKAALGRAVLGSLGLVIGALVGYTHPADDWQPVSLPIRVTMDPRGRAGLVATLQ
jgi:hypothetical protein